MKKSKGNPATILTKSPSTDVLPTDGNDPPKVTVIENPLAVVGVLVTPILPSFPNTFCLPRQENCSTVAGACGKTTPIEQWTKEELEEKEDLLGYCSA